MSLKFDDSVSWVACGYYHTAVVTGKEFIVLFRNGNWCYKNFIQVKKMLALRV